MADLGGGGEGRATPKFCNMYNKINLFHFEESEVQNASKQPHIIAPPPPPKVFHGSATG